MKITQVRSAAILCCAVCGFLAGVARGDILYNNSTTDTGNQLNPGTLEVGDEVVLTGGNTITNFTFQYYASGLSGSATVEIRFYANDGAPFSGVNSPGTLLWYSGAYNGIVNTNGATLSYNLTGSPVTVPTDFTWTVTFSNLGGGTAGVPIYDPVTVGGNYLDYWENDGAPGSSGSWVLKTNASLNIDFAARIQGVPEPSVFAFAAVAGLGMFFRLRRNR